MKRLILALAALALAPMLASCAGTLPTPATAAEATVLDEQVATATELAYKAARLAIETATDAGLIKGPRAAQIAAADTRAYSAVLAVRAAYKAGNAASYPEAAHQAQTAIAALLAAIRGA